MENFKNEAEIIMTLERPLIELDGAALLAMFKQAEFIAKQALDVVDQESFQARLLWETARHMVTQAELEWANRN